MCDSIIPIFSEVMCYSCEKKYEYNLETDKFEPIESKVEADTMVDKNIVNREIGEYRYYVDLFIEVYSGGDNYLNWLKILDDSIVNGEIKREVLYSVVADRREVFEELDDYNQEMFDLQILKTLLLRFSDQKIDVIFKDIRNQLFEQGMQEGCNL